jgi:hypothetical protein
MTLDGFSVDDHVHGRNMSVLATYGTSGDDNLTTTAATTPGCPDARVDACVHVAFRLRNSVGAQDMNVCEAQ